MTTIISRAIGLAVIGLLVVYGVLGSQLFVLNALGTVFLYIALAQSWNLLGGYAGYANFGPVAFFGIGAYTSAILWHDAQLSPFATAPFAGLVAALAGLLVGWPTLRLRGAYFAVVTMMVAFAMQILAFNLPVTQGALGIYLPRLELSPIATERLFYYIFMAFAAAVTALTYVIEHTKIGWALIAIRDDEDAAEVAGVRTAWVKTWINAAACLIAGVAGSLYAQRVGYIEPTTVFSIDITLDIVLIVIVGGMGAWFGPLIGAPFILLSADLLRVTFTSEINRALLGTAMIAFALLLPKGIAGALKKRRHG